MTETPSRKPLENAKRIVVKIGSRAIVGDTPDGRFASLAGQIADLYKSGRTVILVSSGAVAMGCRRLGRTARPKLIPELQAAAAIGQPLLLQAYEAAFSAHGLHAAQVLITHAEVANRQRYLNARAAMDAMTELGAVPIINENDTVSTEELQFGDNDQLAAMVAPLAGADLLVLLTDVEGLLDPNKQRISVVSDIDAAMRLIWPKDNALSMGGMASKLGAARRACQVGVPVVIGPARDPDVLRKIANGDDCGTLFLPAGTALASRKYWIAYTLKMAGTLVVDAGAQRALTEANRSLLPAGIVAVQGAFRAGDAVSIVGQDGRELARGLTRYDARDVQKLLGARSEQIEQRLGFYSGDEIVHRDDLVVL
ncbi:MAG TPA: glutamate 5-kinase [Polyangiales bacterium]|nr:glutamate 5-kinase [Polyangiales bacterium]